MTATPSESRAVCRLTHRLSSALPASWTLTRSEQAALQIVRDALAELEQAHTENARRD